MNNNYNTKSNSIYIDFLNGDLKFPTDSESSDSCFSDSYDKRLDDGFNELIKKYRKRRNVDQPKEVTAELLEKPKHEPRRSRSMDQLFPTVTYEQQYGNYETEFHVNGVKMEEQTKGQVSTVTSVSNGSIVELLTETVKPTPNNSRNESKLVPKTISFTATPNVSKRLRFSGIDFKLTSEENTATDEEILQLNNSSAETDGLMNVIPVEVHVQRRLSCDHSEFVSSSGKEDNNNAVVHERNEADKSCANDKASVQKEPSKTDGVSVQTPIVINGDKGIQSMLRSKRRRLSILEDHSPVESTTTFVDTNAMDEFENGGDGHGEADVERHSPYKIEESVLDLTSPDDNPINSTFDASPSIMHSTARYSKMPSFLALEDPSDSSNWTDCDDSDATTTFTKY